MVASFLGSLSLGALITGCPMSHTRQDDLEDFPARYATALCARDTRCGFTWVDQRALRTTLEGDCAAQIEAAFVDDHFAQLRASIAGGTVVFRPDRVDACIEALETGACRSLAAEACDGVFEGRLADGEGCDLDDQCSATSRCAGAHAVCPSGVCTHVPQEGDACASDSDCARPFYCANAASGAPGICTTRITLGGACDVPRFQCAVGLGCIHLAGSTDHGTCQTLVFGAGAACAPTASECDAGLVCGATASGPGRCRAPRTDGTCELHVNGAQDCPAGQRCSATDAAPTGTCARYPVLGESCIDICGGGARCVGSTCVAVRRLGEPCAVDRECASEQCVSGVCTAPATCAI